MNQKYIFIDIDGTLFDHSTESIPESALIALNKAHKKGHKIYLSTGRANTEIDYEYSALPISGMILSCGAQVIVDNKIIYLANYPRNELTQLMEYMLKNDIGFALDGYKKSYFSDEAFHIFSGLILQNENQNSELARAKMAQKRMYHLDQFQEKDLEQILKISLFSSNWERCQDLMGHIPDSLQGFIYKNENYDLVNGEISMKGINKATGIDKIIAYENASLSDTIAIDDSLNDIEMLKHAKIGICMGNGVQELKEKADFVTKDIGDDGLAYALQYFHLI